MDALGINLPGLTTQLVSFIILLVILTALLWKPVTRGLDERSNRIRESLEAADRVREESARSQEELRTQLEEGRAQVQQEISRARETAEQFRQQELARTQQELEEIRSRAEENIQRERDAAIEELRREFASLAIDAAERVIERSLDETAHREIIEQVLDEGSSRISRN